MKVVTVLIGGSWNRYSYGRFTGHERGFDNTQPNDSSSYIDYMHARYYGATAGRFLSVDPILGNLLRPQAWNRYSYVLGNPVKYVDPNGLRPASSNALRNDSRDGCTFVNGILYGDTTTGDGFPSAREILENLSRDLGLERAGHKFLRTVDEYAGVWRHFDLADAIPHKGDAPCKSYGQLWLDAFTKTNSVFPGAGAPSLLPGLGAGALTAKLTADEMGTLTIMQWAKSGFGASVSRGVAFTRLETGVLAGGTALANFAYITLAWEGGVAVGSTINAALTDGCGLRW